MLQKIRFLHFLKVNIQNVIRSVEIFSKREEEILIRRFHIWIYEAHPLLSISGKRPFQKWTFLHIHSFNFQQISMKTRDGGYWEQLFFLFGDVMTETTCSINIISTESHKICEELPFFIEFSKIYFVNYIHSLFFVVNVLRIERSIVHTNDLFVGF